MIPVLLAQTDQTFTMILYHADAPSYLRTRAKHLFISRLRSEGVDLSFSQTMGPYQVDDLRDLPLIERKRRLAKLIGRAKRRAIRFIEHLAGDGPTVFEHVCRMGLEGIVSKRTDAPYRSGPSKTWLKSKNPASEAVRREREEEWC